jgi:sugar phosphate isomerase/epimerase
MHISTLLSSLPLEFEAALIQAAGLGFRWVDVVALTDRPEEDFHALAQSGLLVSCAALGRNLPEGHSLDAASAEVRGRTLEQVKRHITDAAHLGATHAYVIPGLDATEEGVARFGEACVLLADHAAGRKVLLCVEHIPGRALPTVEGTLRWLEKLDHPGLALLLDIGHCSISGENAPEAIREAGSELGYVHFDDNDGVNDLHWPLLQGQYTREKLEGVIAALRDIGYDGALSLELNARNRDPVGDLRAGKKLLEEICVSLARASG